MNGINIYTKSEDWLGRALTNVHYAKNNKSNFDINPKLNDLIKIKPECFSINHNTNARNRWGNSVEAWYKANSKDLPQKTKQTIMLHLMVCKFKTYPILITEIDKRGGLEFLKLCSHVVSGNKNWEGVGEKSNFIKVLIQAYKHNKGIPMNINEQEELFQ